MRITLDIENVNQDKRFSLTHSSMYSIIIVKDKGGEKMLQAVIQDPRTTTVRLPGNLMQWLENYAERAGISKNLAMIVAVAELKAKVERYERRTGKVWKPELILR